LVNNKAEVSKMSEKRASGESVPEEGSSGGGSGSIRKKRIRTGKEHQRSGVTSMSGRTRQKEGRKAQVKCREDEPRRERIVCARGLPLQERIEPSKTAASGWVKEKGKNTNRPYARARTPSRVVKTRLLRTRVCQRTTRKAPKEI